MFVAYPHSKSYNEFDRAEDVFKERFEHQIYQASIYHDRKDKTRPLSKQIDKVWSKLYKGEIYSPHVSFSVLKHCLQLLDVLPPFRQLKRIIALLTKSPHQSDWQLIKTCLSELDYAKDPKGALKKVDSLLNALEKEQAIPGLKLDRVLTGVQHFVTWVNRGHCRFYIESEKRLQGQFGGWLKGNTFWMPPELSLRHMSLEDALYFYFYFAIKGYMQWQMGINDFQYDNLPHGVLEDMSERAEIFERNLEWLEDDDSLSIATDWHRFLLCYKNPRFAQAVFNCLQQQAADETLRQSLPGLMVYVDRAMTKEGVMQRALELLPVEQVLLEQLSSVLSHKGRLNERYKESLLPPIRELATVLKDWSNVKHKSVQAIAEYTAYVMTVLEQFIPEVEIDVDDLKNLLEEIDNGEGNKSELEGVNGEPIDADLYPAKDREDAWEAKGIAYPEYNIFEKTLEHDVAFVNEHLSPNETEGYKPNVYGARHTAHHGYRLDLSAYHHRIASKRAGIDADIPVFKKSNSHEAREHHVQNVLCILIDGTSSMFNSENCSNSETAWYRAKRLVLNAQDQLPSNTELHVYTAYDKGRQSIELLPLHNEQGLDENKWNAFIHTGQSGFRYGTIYRHLKNKYDLTGQEVRYLILTDTGSQYLGWGYDELMLDLGKKCESCDKYRTEQCEPEETVPSVHLLGEGRDIAMYLPFSYGLIDLNHAMQEEGLMSTENEVSLWCLGHYNVQPLLDKFTQIPGMYRWHATVSQDQQAIRQWVMGA